MSISDFLENPFKRPVSLTRAAMIAKADAEASACITGRRFSLGTRPVIRWIKGDGLDDLVTRAAIGQATRLFGSEVDYCLCTQGLDAARVRKILAWADQPVEWWPISEDDNRVLARLLQEAGCRTENFGYWWKWFPERVRPDAPEWILDGDMVIVKKPDWYDKWILGADLIRVSQDDAESPEIYGNYAHLVNTELMLYSGLISLPAGCRYMPFLEEILTICPLVQGHNGKTDMCEQGVIALTFQKLNATPVPLNEFPFCRAFQDFIDYGIQGDCERAWGYHFGNSFVMKNPHFERMTAAGVIFSKPATTVAENFRWLGGYGQWGIPGWAMTDYCTDMILKHAAAFKGRQVLEIGTSRGRLTAMLAALGCIVTTVDHIDRGAKTNLEGLSVTVIHDDAIRYLQSSSKWFDLVIVDFHGNSKKDWKRYAAQVKKKINQGCTLIINNIKLSKIAEWHEETGPDWFLKKLSGKYFIKLYDEWHPGVAVITKKSNGGSIAIPGLQYSREAWFLIRRRLTLTRDKAVLEQSGLFDLQYYLENNSDIRDSGVDPIRHYLLHGGFEGRKPCDHFDSRFYLERYPDVTVCGMNPLLHYIRHGRQQERSANGKHL